MQQQSDGLVTVKGKGGGLSRWMPKKVRVLVEDRSVWVKLAAEDSPLDKESKSLLGTARVLLANMVKGVSEGCEVKLLLVGVGYRAKVQGNALELTLGYSHPVLFKAPPGVTLETPSATEIVVKGADSQQVGQVAAEIRRFRPIEPYKGKGIRRVADAVPTFKVPKKKKGKGSK